MPNQESDTAAACTENTEKTIEAKKIKKMNYSQCKSKLTANLAPAYTFTCTAAAVSLCS